MCMVAVFLTELFFGVGTPTSYCAIIGHKTLNNDITATKTWLGLHVMVHKDIIWIKGNRIS